MSIHAFLKSLRESRGLSLADVAGVAGVARPAVWRAETKPYLVKGATLRAILQGLKIPEGSRDWSRAVALWTAARMKSESNSEIMERLLGRVAQLKPAQLRALKEWLDERQK